MFYRQGSRRSVQRTLGERCEDTRHAAHRLVNQAGSDSYHMTTPGLAHQQHRALSHVKEACDIGSDVSRVIVIRIGGEWLGYERAGVVDQRIDAAEAIQCLLKDQMRDFASRWKAANREEGLTPDPTRSNTVARPRRTSTGFLLARLPLE